MLALNGVGERDVSFETAGGGVQRFDALKQGKHAGTFVSSKARLISCRVIKGWWELHGAAGLQRTQIRL